MKRQTITDETLVNAAFYLLEEKASIRETAVHFNIAHSSLVKAFHNRLPDLFSSLYRELLIQLAINKKEGPKKGGLARHKSN